MHTPYEALAYTGYPAAKRGLLILVDKPIQLGSDDHMYVLLSSDKRCSIAQRMLDPANPLEPKS